MKKLILMICILIFSANSGFCAVLKSGGETHFAQQEFIDTVLMQEQEFLNMAKAGTVRDIAFSQLINKYREAADNLNLTLLESADVNDKYYKNNWVKLTLTEGTYFYVINYNYIRKKYAKYITPTYNEWLKYLDKHVKIFEDGGLAIPVDDLRKNIVKLEKFIKTNSDFAALSEVKDELEISIRAYLMGSENTPVFDTWDTKKMSPDYKASYENFLKQNVNSNYYPHVKELYDKAKENDFNCDKNLDDWFYETYRVKYFDY